MWCETKNNTEKGFFMKQYCYKLGVYNQFSFHGDVIKLDGNRMTVIISNSKIH